REQFGDSEIEQLRRAVFSHQDVARLEVPVDDQLAMRVLDGGTNVAEEFELLVERKLTPVAIGGHLFARDNPHNKISLPPYGRAAVEQASDVRMIERSQYLPLAQESFAHKIRFHAGLDEFDGDSLSEFVVVAHGFIHRAHAAASDQARQAIWTDALARKFIGRRGGDGVRRFFDRVIEKG